MTASVLLAEHPDLVDAALDLVRDRSENAEVPFDRIVESIHIGFTEQPP